MGSYLQGYGVEDARRGRMIRVILLGIVAAALLAWALYWFLHDHAEKQVARSFLSQVNAQNYRAAYDAWCPGHPCENYDFHRFMDDWGTKNQNNGPWKIDSVDSCKGFLTVNVIKPGAELQSLSIERTSLALSYAPSPECQEYKWHWKQFFQRLFGGGKT